MAQNQPHVLVLGTRGVPASHGGFETFAEKLALYLVERGWRVTVYCQDDVPAVTQRFSTDTWRGIERVNVQTAHHRRARTIEFDWHSTRHAATQEGVCLCSVTTRRCCWRCCARRQERSLSHGRIEWQRPKWSRLSACGSISMNGSARGSDTA